MNEPMQSPSDWDVRPRGKGRNKHPHKPSGVAKARRAARKARNLKRK
jgi:hypothetical protein